VRNKAVHMTFGTGVPISRPRFAQVPEQGRWGAYVISDFGIAPISVTPDPSKAPLWMMDAGLRVEALAWNPAVGMVPVKAWDVAFEALRGHAYFTGGLSSFNLEARLSDGRLVKRFGQVDWLGTEQLASTIRMEFLIKQGTIAELDSLLEAQLAAHFADDQKSGWEIAFKQCTYVSLQLGVTWAMLGECWMTPWSHDHRVSLAYMPMHSVGFRHESAVCKALGQWIQPRARPQDRPESNLAPSARQDQDMGGTVVVHSDVA